MLQILLSEPSLLLKQTLQNLVKEVIGEKNDFNYASLDFLENSFEEIIDTLQSSSFGSEKKLVVVKNPYFFTETKIKLPFENHLEDLEYYLAHPNISSEFIIICEKKYYNPKNKFFTKIKKYAEVKSLFIDTPQDLKIYALELIKNAKIEIDSKALEILLERCNDVTKLENEIGKLSLYGQKIDNNLIELFVAKPLESNIFELSNALMKKDINKTMQIYTDLKKLKIEPIQLISMLANQFRLMLQVVILRKKYRGDDEIATILKVHPYRVKLSREYSRDYPIEQLKKMLVDLSQLDIDIKRGIKDRFIDLEIFLATC